MARIRSVHPSLFTDEAWVSCSPLARILYIGLMCDADDQGLFEWKPLQIKMRLLPGDTADIPGLLDELCGVNLIARLDAGGKHLGAIRYFRRFQRPKKPNAHFMLPPEWRTYVGLGADGSELPEDDGGEVRNQFPTGGEKSPQMEDGGGKKERKKDKPSSSAGKPAKPRSDRRNPAVSIPDGFPDADALAEQRAKASEAGADLDVLYQAERFRGWALSKDQKFADWRAAWRNWMVKAIADAPKASAHADVALTEWRGPEKIIRLLTPAFGPDKARDYLAAYCAWQEVPYEAVIVANEQMAKLILSKCEPAFRAEGVAVLVKGRAA